MPTLEAPWIVHTVLEGARWGRDWLRFYVYISEVPLWGRCSSDFEGTPIFYFAGVSEAYISTNHAQGKRQIAVIAFTELAPRIPAVFQPLKRVIHAIHLVS